MEFTFKMFRGLQIFQTFYGNHRVVSLDKIVYFFGVIVLIWTYNGFDNQSFVGTGNFVSVKLCNTEINLKRLLQFVRVIKTH